MKKKTRSDGTLRMLLRMTWKLYRRQMILTLVVTLLGQTAEFLTGTYMLGFTVNALREQRPVSGIFSFLLLASLVTVAADTVRMLYVRRIKRVLDLRSSVKLGRILHERALHTDLSAYESPEMYALYGRAISGGVGALSQTAYALPNIIGTVYTAVLSITFAIRIDPIILIFAVPPAIFGLLRTKALSREQHKLDLHSSEISRREEYAGRVFCGREYAGELRMTSISNVILAQLRECGKQHEQLLRGEVLRLEKRRFLRFLPNRISTLLCTLWLAARVMLNRTVPIGDFFIASSAVTRLAGAITGTIQKLSDIYGYIFKFNDFKDYMEHIDPVDSKQGDVEAHGGDIELRGVRFRYNGADDDTLCGIDLTIRQGEHIAVVGQNGAGKTTLVKLLMRLYDPTAGELLLDGNPAADYRLDSYRASFGTVFQDYTPTAFSVAENVLCRPYASADEQTVLSAVGRAGLGERIGMLPDGIETPMTREFSADGLVLSGGELQRLAIAGIYARDGRTVILDEPSAALDPLAERELYRSMYDACRGKTVIFISHRLASAVDADRIILMEHGRISEQGSHTELIAAGGKYAEMFRAQAEAYNE